MSQTTVSLYGAASVAGMLDGVGPRSVRSYAAEEAIPVGYPVMLGTDPAKEVLKATEGETAIGFAVVDPTIEQTSAGVVEYDATETVGVMTQGRMWVMTSDAVVAGATANMTVADGTLTDASVATGIEAFVKISVVFITATSAAGLALVEVK